MEYLCIYKTNFTRRVMEVPADGPVAVIFFEAGVSQMDRWIGH